MCESGFFLMTKLKTSAIRHAEQKCQLRAVLPSDRSPKTRQC